MSVPLGGTITHLKISKHLLLILFISLPQFLFAGDEAIPNDEKEPSIATTEHPRWESGIKEKYELTDEQMKTLKDSGLSYPQIAKVAYLSKNSSKSMSEILAMRNEQKMGWGKIAKELNVHPGELGRAVSSLHRERHEERLKHRENQIERKEKNMERKEQRAQDRAERVNNRKEK